VKGRKRHLLVDTEGLVLKARVHSAKVPDADGIRLLLEPVRDRFGRLSHLWVDAGYQGRGKRWAEEAMGLSVEVVREPQKPLPEKVARVWAAEWAKEGKAVDWQRLMPPRGVSVCCRVGGWWSAPSRGSATTGGWPKTTRGCAPPERPSFTQR
jgi:transposase